MVDTVAVEGTHWWSTLDMYAALDWVGRQTLPDDPDAFQIFADCEKAYLGTDVRDIAPQTIARYSFTLGSGNDFDLLATKNLDVIALDLARLGLDPTQTLTFDAATSDDSFDVIVLEGYTSAPSAVLEDGLPASWVHYPGRGELLIAPGAKSAAFTVQP
jgi:hypothetical protein